MKIGDFYVGTARYAHAPHARKGPCAAIGALLPSSHADALYLLPADTPRPTYSASDGITNAHSATIARPTDMFIHSYRPGTKLPARVPSVTDPDHTNVHPLYHLGVENPARSKPFFVRSQQGYPMLRGELLASACRTQSSFPRCLSALANRRTTRSLIAQKKLRTVRLLRREQYAPELSMQRKSMGADASSANMLF